MFAWFVTLAFWFGPNVILFGKLTRMTPNDFVPIVQKYCVPAVRAIKIYQRTNGRLPASLEELGPPYSQDNGPGLHMIDSIHPYTYWDFGMYNHEISYDFHPGHEGWTVRGAFANGPIPAPAVTIDANATTGP